VFRYEPANRQTTADFLVSVTNPSSRIPRAGFTSAPRTAAEFADYFKKSKLGQTNKADMESYESDFVNNAARASEYMESAQEEHMRGLMKGR
jgi:ATP-binding cassette subfamily G (WHITE) protein 2 (SNQ2)